MISSAEEFVRLRTSTDPAEYTLSATAAASLNVWLEVISRFQDMRCWVAHNKTVPIEVLELLATDPSAEVRFAVGSKRKLSVELQNLLAQDHEPSVRMAIASNAKCDVSILEHLSHDKDTVVRESAVLNLTRRAAL